MLAGTDKIIFLLLLAISSCNELAIISGILNRTSSRFMLLINLL